MYIYLLYNGICVEVIKKIYQNYVEFKCIFKNLEIKIRMLKEDILK